MMAKRKTIGDNPLDALLHPAEVSIDQESIPMQRKVNTSKEVIASPRKERMTVQISADIINRIKNAVYWTPGLTLAALTEKALKKAVDNLEREKPFPPRNAKLKTGRPIK